MRKFFIALALFALIFQPSLSYSDSIISLLRENISLLQENKVLLQENQAMLRQMSNPWEPAGSLRDVMEEISRGWSNNPERTPPKSVLDYEYMVVRNGAPRDIEFSVWEGAGEVMAVSEEYLIGNKEAPFIEGTREAGDIDFSIARSIWILGTRSDYDDCPPGRVYHYYIEHLRDGQKLKKYANGCTEIGAFRRKVLHKKDVATMQ